MPANRVHGTLLQRSVSFLFGITIFVPTCHSRAGGNPDTRPFALDSGSALRSTRNDDLESVIPENTLGWPYPWVWLYSLIFVNLKKKK